MYTYILWSEGGEKFEVMEAVRLRVGLRSVEVSEGRLRVNGRAVTLRGVNRHEHTADAGHVISVQVDIFEKSARISICSGCQLACKNIQGLAPPRCPFDIGTTVVQIIST